MAKIPSQLDEISIQNDMNEFMGWNCRRRGVFSDRMKIISLQLYSNLESGNNPKSEIWLSNNDRGRWVRPIGALFNQFLALLLCLPIFYLWYSSSLLDLQYPPTRRWSWMISMIKHVFDIGVEIELLYRPQLVRDYDLSRAATSLTVWQF
jgi:hypothetical protein